MASEIIKRTRIIYNDGKIPGLQSVWVWPSSSAEYSQVGELWGIFPWLEYLQVCDDHGNPTSEERLTPHNKLPIGGTYRMFPDVAPPDDYRVYIDKKAKFGVVYHDRFCIKMDMKKRTEIDANIARYVGLVPCKDCQPNIPLEIRSEITTVKERQRV